MYAGLLQPNLQVLSPEIEQKETTTEQKDQNNALYALMLGGLCAGTAQTSA